MGKGGGEREKGKERKGKRERRESGASNGAWLAINDMSKQAAARAQAEQRKKRTKDANHFRTRVRNYRNIAIGIA